MTVRIRRTLLSAKDALTSALSTLSMNSRIVSFVHIYFQVTKNPPLGRVFVEKGN